MQLQLGLITRSKNTDYTPISQPMRDPNWWSSYQHYAHDTKPTLIVEGKRDSYGDPFVRFFVSGIHSQREDKVGTPIRYSIFGAVYSADGVEQVGRLRCLLEALCQENFHLLGQRLDSEIDEATIERCLSSNGDDAGQEEVLQGLSRFWRQLVPDAPIREPSSRTVSVVGGRKNLRMIGILGGALLALREFGQGRVLFLKYAAESDYAELQEQPFIGLLDDESEPANLKKKEGVAVLAQLRQKERLGKVLLIVGGAIVGILLLREILR